MPSHFGLVVRPDGQLDGVGRRYERLLVSGMVFPGLYSALADLIKYLVKIIVGI